MLYLAVVFIAGLMAGSCFGALMLAFLQTGNRRTTWQGDYHHDR